MTYDPDSVITALEDIKAKLGAQYDETVTRIRRTDHADDREAAKIGVEVAKIFMTIALAAFALIGVFARFYLSDGYSLYSWKLVCLGLSASLALISLIIGQAAIASVYKRAAGLAKENKTRLPKEWSVEAIRERLNGQAFVGLLAVLLFGLAVAFGGKPAAPIQSIELLSLTPQAKTSSASASFAPPFVISGNRDHVKVEREDGAVFMWKQSAEIRTPEEEPTEEWSLRISPQE